MKKVNKHTVLKAARDKGYWCGYIAEDKVNEYYIAGGWNLGYKVEIKAVHTEGAWIYTVNNDKTLVQFINAVICYQADSLGNSISFWAED